MSNYYIPGIVEAWAHSIEELDEVPGLKKLTFLREVTINK